MFLLRQKGTPSGRFIFRKSPPHSQAGSSFHLKYCLHSQPLITPVRPTSSRRFLAFLVYPVEVDNKGAHLGGWLFLTAPHGRRRSYHQRHHCLKRNFRVYKRPNFLIISLALDSFHFTRSEVFSITIMLQFFGGGGGVF